MAEKTTKGITGQDVQVPDQTREREQAQGDQGGADAAQELPPTHPEDPTETTLTQGEAPDPEGQAKAVRRRLGEDA